MKHPSRWPWFLRAPLCLIIILALWWGPLFLLLVGFVRWGVFENLGSEASFLVGGAVLVGWSAFIMKAVVHPRIEPFFNVRSMQNPHKELFTPEPVHSFRDWLRLMFRGH